MSRGADKANQYLSALYEARCSGNWQDVPELARKVEKHAPGKKLLALSSRAGARFYGSPSSSNYWAAHDEFNSRLHELLPPTADPLRGDNLDGAVCRAAILLGTAQYDTLVASFPGATPSIEPPTQGSGQQGWEAACVLQGALIRGIALEHVGESAAASQNYRSIIGYISHVVDLPSRCPQLLKWTEELLCQICVFFSTTTGQTHSQLGEAMAGFHLLSRYLDLQSWKALSPTPTFCTHSPRTVWRAYYEALSTIVREDLVYHPSPIYRDHDTLEHRGLLDDDDFLASRIRQRGDLRRVETNYENLLLRESEFPKANETNVEVKAWVETLMSNWRILCGPTWTSEELGAGGKTIVGRTTLDMLYRAATKTFHSTQILRHLFSVHVYLGEFDLALKAFDSYVEIMTRGKARAEKIGDAGLDLDDDATAVLLAAEAIRVSCRYGYPEGAERSLHIGDRLEGWLAKGTPQTSDKQLRDDSKDEGQDSEIPKASAIPPEVESVALAAIGMCQANFARFVHSPTQRTELYDKALNNLRLATESETPQAVRAESLYALALVLAETRNISDATDVVRAALNNAEGAEALAAPDGLISEVNGSDSGSSTNAKFSQRRRLLPVWHLLAQLLCARESYPLALNCCGVALEQFKSTAKLVNESSKRHNRQKNSLSVFSARNQPSPSLEPASEQMDLFEKQTLLEIKMTQLSLVEIMDGPEAAVNACNELFSLFTRHFGVLDDERQKPSRSATLSPPKSSAGTMRSVFGRSKASTVTSQRQPAAVSELTTRPGTSATNAPTIQVTNANGAWTPARQSVESRRFNSLKKKTSGSLRRTKSGRSRPTTAQGTAYSTTTSTAYVTARPSIETQRPQTGKANGEASEHTSQPAPNKSLGGVAHNMTPEKTPPPAGQYNPPPTMDTRLPVPAPGSGETSPTPHLTKLQEYRHKIGLLIQIWLFVARLYSNASVFEDAGAAIDEANKLVADVESAVSKESASLKLFQEHGWGGWKSIEDLSADVCNERGRLLAAQSLPHDALRQLEQALSHSPDHAEAIVALSHILLDIHAGVIPAEKPDPDALAIPVAALGPLPTPTPGKPSDSRTLNRLAARDRAYGLLSSLTKLGAGWDDAEAWFALARAYEESGQLDKAKDALWWCVHLEDSKPVRHWRHVSPGGYVL